MEVEWIDQSKKRLPNNKYSVLILFTQIDVCLLPVEIWSLIATYLQLTDMFNLSRCSKFFYAVVHKNICLDEKMNILKRLISND